MDEGEKPTDMSEESEEAAPGTSTTSDEATETGEAASAGNTAEETLDNIFGSPSDHSIASTSSGISTLRNKNPMLDTILDKKIEPHTSQPKRNLPSTEDQGTFKVPAVPTSPRKSPKKRKPLEGLGAVLFDSQRSGAIKKSPTQKESPPRTHQPKSPSSSGTIRDPSTSQSGKGVSAFESALKQFREPEEVRDYSLITLKTYEKQMTLPGLLEDVAEVASPTPDILLTCLQGAEDVRKLVPVIDLSDSDSNSSIPPLPLDAEVSSEPRSAFAAEGSSEPRSAFATEGSSEPRSFMETEVSSESRSIMETEESSGSKSIMETDETSESLSAMETEDSSEYKSRTEDLSESKSLMDTEDGSESRSDMETEDLPESKSATDSAYAGQAIRIIITDESSSTDNLPVESRETDLPIPEKSAEETRLKKESKSSAQHSQESIAKESDNEEETDEETDKENETDENSTKPPYPKDPDNQKRRSSSETSYEKASKQPRL